ncbi:hypothetical protein COW80_04150 [Candidatus Beckwithbacteria bacterium CG22_combo_CG10-13_8_21_14_all_01_47_9]|uniref:Nucleotidyl transferase AbiEii/AbiGii toxin family protein n=1 Tax=Candidatus Beckwithbacteria bacterium CG22_combo_CG10-13_8_21_14_all_01_47_9 TaxID=1974496 RepID=A0A2H0E010_9BACT|nr:MAG: hypothetical protein COW80_04150 [Candidatus Beckwithbacteria bacterium CG22_combo_CG10-13_8_21_14_all_01_47_9]
MASMIINELKEIIREQTQKGLSGAYIRNALKEYLQVYVLNFLYTTDQYKQALIFTGGTCLRHCFNLNRLSEDIDFDQLAAIDVKQLANSLSDYFSKKYLYSDLKISIKQKGRQLLLKFPVLQALKLVSQSESDWLYVKLDISLSDSKKFQTKTTLKNIYGFNYVMKHYSLADLMSGKIAAVLTRQRFWGESNQTTIKGRDYFDLLWFLDKQIIPNLSRINDLIKETLSSKELVERLNEKVDLATSKFKLDFKRDLLPFVTLSETSISDYLESYQDNYLEKVQYLLNTSR